MAATVTTAPADDAQLFREPLRTFHLSGQGLEEAIPTGALRPSILNSLALPDLEASYPMCVHPDGFARPFREVVGELEHAGIITSAFRIAMKGQPSGVLEEVAPTAIDSLVECSKAEIAHLRKLLPAGAFLVGFHADSLVLLHGAMLAEARRLQRARFWEEVEHTASRLREILTLDEAHAPGAISADSVTASLGQRVGSFFNAARLAEALQGPRNPSRRMDAERRSRCEITLAMLKEGLRDSAQYPAFWLFHSGVFGASSAPEVVSQFRGSAKWAVDSFAAALQFCDARLDQFTHLLRALRVARLEIDAMFSPQIHEEMLARFDWQSASAGELNALPPIVVIETADCLAQASLTSFGRLLRSGLPVQVLILRSGLEPQDLHEFTPDFGYLSIAHRESFVLQSSMAQPSHLLPGLAAMAKTLRPAVAVVAGPRRQEEDASVWREESLLILSRTFPLYSYNPESGAHWKERFQLLAHDVTHEDLTAAHTIAVSDHFRQQFRIVPPSAWTSEQMELKPYLEAYTHRPPLAIPYLWVETKDGTQQRAMLTRDLVNFCVDRRRAWALFDELAEIGKPQPVPNENAREEGARDTIQQVLAMLNVRQT